MASERTRAQAAAAMERRPAAVAAAVPRGPAAGTASAAQGLRQRLGNQGTQALVHRLAGGSGTPAPAQAGLAVSQPGDAHELEAERVADAVMRMPGPGSPSAPVGRAPAAVVQRLCAQCENERGSAAQGPAQGDLPVHRKEDPDPAAQEPPQVEADVRALQREGSPLPPATRAFFEPRFGADFGQVRVNTGARAAQTAKALGARAFTVGPSISFGAGQYAPNSHEGQRLLAHELTHVVQQEGAVRRAPSVPRSEEQAAGQADSVPAARSLDISSAGGVPRLQAAWYNVDIPFTDYQFDPSIEGVKTAAGIVKDAAVDAFDWIVDRIAGLVSSGIAWLSAQWESLKAIAESAFESVKKAFANIVGFVLSPLRFLADAIMRMDGQAVATAWATFSKLISTASEGFKAFTDTFLLQRVNSIWSGISGFATSLLNQVANLTQSFVFRKLPDSLQRTAFGFVEKLKRAWKSIDDGFKATLNNIKTWVDGAIDAVFAFVRKVLSFSINVVIAGIIAFGKIVIFLKDFFADPKKYLTILAQRAVKAFDGVENRFAGIVGKYFGDDKAAAAPSGVPPLKVQRQAQPAAATPETKRTATWSEIGHGVLHMMEKKWQEFKANPLQLVMTLLLDLCLPIVGNVKDVIQLFSDIKKIVSAPFSAGSLQELWTSLLQILEIPRLIAHTVVGIVMRTLMLPLIVASFIPEPIVQTIATAVGYALLGAFLQMEMINLAHKLLLLKTGRTVKSQRDDACNSIADSLIALIMAGLMTLIVLVLKFIVNVARGIINFIKGKLFTPPEVKPVETKGAGGQEAKGGPGEEKGGAKEGSQKGEPREGAAGKEMPSADGKRKIKLNEKGKCEVCFSPCDDVRKKYGPVIRPDIEARIKAIESDAALSDLQKIDKLKPVEQELADLAKARAERLAKDPQTHKENPKSIDERDAILQAEKEGHVQKPERPNLEKGDPNLDFKVEGPKPYQYADVKTPVNRGDLVAQAEGIGRKVVLQKAGATNVLHVIDLKNIPAAEKPTFKANVLKTATSPTGIVFIND